MLTQKEKDGAVKFLSTEFTTPELVSIVETVTSRMVTVRSKREAIKAIILHSESAVELLKRKKVKKEYIFRHLASHHVGVSPASEKEELMRQLLAFWCWGTTVPDEEQQVSGDNHSEIRRVPQTPQATVVTVPNKTYTQTLAEQFATWFYQQLNSLQVGANSSTGDKWGPHHFWKDAKLNLAIQASDARQETFHGDELVAQRFQSLICEEGLLFNPNVTSEGTRGLQDPHGLVMVVVCGTVHRGSECLGWFEQRFGLIRDPLKENNWKIKFTDLNMKKGVVQRMPMLTAGAQPAICT